MLEPSNTKLFGGKKFCFKTTARGPTPKDDFKRDSERIILLSSHRNKSLIFFSSWDISSLFSESTSFIVT